MDQPERLLVRDIMVRDPVTVSPNVSVAETAILMGERNIGAVAICRGDLLVGIFTERDLLRRAATERHHWESTPVAVFMSSSPISVSPHETWAGAMELMDRRRVRHLPVVDGMRLVGMLSLRDLLQHRARYLEWTVQKSTSELAAKHQELAARDELMQFHLGLAARIQRSLLPASLPQITPFAFEVLYRPMEMVSGDYYDFATPAPGCLGILIADASGHSVPAAFVSIMANTTFRAFGLELLSPAAVLRMLNQRLTDLMASSHFVTMFYGMLNTATSQLTYARAGHPPPLWSHAETRTVTPLDAEGPIIGLLESPEFEERTVQLAAGDAILLYTDGVIECANATRSLFGKQRLSDLLLSSSAVPSSSIIAHLDAALAAHRGDEPFGDDVTAVALLIGR